jgi:hypothetical protein
VPVYAHLQDWTVHEDGQDESIGRIMEGRESSSRPEYAWSWSITSMMYWEGRATVTTSGNAPTLEQAKADFRSNWKRLKAWVVVQSAPP